MNNTQLLRLHYMVYSIQNSFMLGSSNKTYTTGNQTFIWSIILYNLYLTSVFKNHPNECLSVYQTSNITISGSTLIINYWYFIKHKFLIAYKILTNY